MALKPMCLCNRPNCGLITGELDDLDYALIWLPGGYKNFVKDSPFLESEDKKSDYLNDDLESTVDEYLDDIRKHNARIKKMRNWKTF